jgi:hypothetical protein
VYGGLSGGEAEAENRVVVVFNTNHMHHALWNALVYYLTLNPNTNA